MEKLLKQDTLASSQVLIKNGQKLIKNSVDAIDHLVGEQPEALGLVPSLYFYSENGKYVRSLLYGFAYWLFTRNDKQIVLNKKLLFSVYRALFEKVLILNKKELVSRFARRSGSGPEVTKQVAEFYNNLLELLIKHNGNIGSEVFVEEYENIAKHKASNDSDATLISLPKCAICSGLLNVTDKKDDIKKESKMQEDVDREIPIAHLFCQNNRDLIIKIANGSYNLELPYLFAPKASKGVQQLSFIDLGSSFLD